MFRTSFRAKTRKEEDLCVRQLPLPGMVNEMDRRMMMIVVSVSSYSSSIKVKEGDEDDTLGGPGWSVYWPEGFYRQWISEGG